MNMDIWKQRDGTPIRVADMEDSHVVNARNMMARNLMRGERLERACPDKWQEIGRRVDKCLAWINRFNEELKNRKR